MPVSVSISMTGSIPAGLATCYLYAGSAIGQGSFVDSTYNVNNASSSMISGQTIWPGQSIFAVWSGGNAGATATMVVQGSRTVP